MENRIKSAAAHVEANVERFVALEKGRTEVSRHLDAFERDEPPLARETTLVFLAGTVVVALLVAAATWLLLREPAPAANRPHEAQNRDGKDFRSQRPGYEYDGGKSMVVAKFHPSPAAQTRR